MRSLTFLAALCLGTSSSLAQSGETLSQKIDRLVSAVNVQDVPKIEFSGEGFLDLPKEALPFLEKAAKRKDLLWTAHASIAKGIRKINERAKGLDWAVEHEAERDEMRRLVVGEYERVSRRDKRWDKEALEAVRGTADFWGKLFRRTDEEGQTVGVLAKRALDAGCDDPLVVYIYAEMQRSGHEMPLSEQVDAYERAARALDSSRYHPLLKSFAHKFTAQAILREARPGAQVKDRIEPHLRKALEELLAALTLPQAQAVNSWTILGYSREIWTLWKRIGDSKDAFEPMAAVVRKTQPKTGLADLLAGRFFVDYAWEARGGSWAQNVKPEAWELFQDRLQKARASVEAAWKANPREVVGPQIMMSVTLGDNRAPEEMELWFGRGVEVFPDDHVLYSGKLYYLEPKWHGSPEEMLRFGRQCALTGNWDADIPWILLDAHCALSRYSKEGYRAETDYRYFENASVWDDVKALYERSLKRNPDQPALRASYAFYACQSKHWRGAHEQFALLGEEPPQVGLFRTLEKYRSAKEEAARMVKTTDF